MTIMIDREFRGMIPPLKADEYKSLEESLRQEGCRNPIVLWNDVIVDGHNRYEICTRLDIPYRTVQRKFSSREEAVSWICLNQLSRRNLSEEAFRYLVGKRYDAEKIIAQRRNAAGTNQYSVLRAQDENADLACSPCDAVQRRTSSQIGDLYNLNHATVERYGRLSRSLDEIERKSPGTLPIILSGACKISKDNIDVLAKMPSQDISIISSQLHSKVINKKRVTAKESRLAIQKMSDADRRGEATILITGVKSMPAYDPDAKLNEILLTVPTWKNQLDRMLEKDDFTDSSREARYRLFRVLSELQSSISKLQARIKR